MPKHRDSPTRENSRAKKKKKQEDDTTKIAADGAATANVATTVVSAPAVSSSPEIQEMLQEKEEFSLLAKEKITGAATYERGLRLALQKVEGVKAEYQSMRATVTESYCHLYGMLEHTAARVCLKQRGIDNLTQRIGAIEARNYRSNENAIDELTKRLDSRENTIADLIKAITDLRRRLEATEAENCLLRAYADTQKDINKDIKAAIRNLQGGMKTSAGGA